MAYATVTDVQARMARTMSSDEQTRCGVLLNDAAVFIDTYNVNAEADAKKIVSCNMVVRALGDGEATGIPLGATQGSQSGLGYSQSWTISNGSSGELYISKQDKKLLKVGDKLGARSPLEHLVEEGLL